MAARGQNDTGAAGRRRLASIDALKGVAIVGVLAQHALPDGTLHAIGADFHIRQAVPVLFVLLGYNAMQGSRRTADATLAQAYGRAYWESRLWRIVLPFAVWWLVAAVVGLLAGDAHVGPLTLVGVMPVDGPGSYFVTILFTFVVLQPALVHVCRRAPGAFVLGALAVDVAFELLAGQVPSLQDGGYPYGYDAALPRYAFAIALGMSLAMHDPGVERRRRIALACIPLSLAYLVWLELDPGAFSFLVPGFGQATNVAAVPWATGLMLGFLRWWPAAGIRGTRWLERLGLASYHVFLVQITWFGLLPDRTIWRLPIDVLVCGVVGWLLLRHLPDRRTRPPVRPAPA